MFTILAAFAWALAARLDTIPLPAPTHLVAEPAVPDWMHTDVRLQRLTSIEVNGRPLGTVLDMLTREISVPLRAAPELKEYRVSLHVAS